MEKTLKALLRNISCAALCLVWPENLLAQAIRIDGSSTVYPISKAEADGFHQAMRRSVA